MITPRVPGENSGENGGSGTVEQRNKTVSETFRNYITAIALVIGGGWALFEYSTLLQKESAIANLELTRVQAEEKRAILLPKLNLDMTERFMLDEQQRIWLTATVEIVNVGLSGTTLDIKLEPFRISKVLSVGEDGKLEVGPIRHVGKLKLRSSEEATDGIPTWNVTNISVQAGQTKRFPFAIDLPERGLYYMEFRARLSEKSREEWIEIGMPDDINLNWAISKFVTTEETLDPNATQK